MTDQNTNQQEISLLIAQNLTNVIVLVGLVVAFLAYRDWQLAKSAPDEQNRVPFSAKFVLIILGGVVFVWMVSAIFRNTSQGTGFATVAGLILLGVAAVIGIMNLLSVSAARIGILDGRQPFGLPEGSVRAILTMAFIVLVGVLSAFLLTGNRDRTDYSAVGQVVATGLSGDAANIRAKEMTDTFRDSAIVAVVEEKNNDGSAKPAGEKTYSVSVHSRTDHTVSDDIAKQTLTMISTILAAMIGFYFASRGGGEGADPAVIRKTSAAAELSELVSKSAAPNQLKKIGAGLAERKGDAEAIADPEQKKKALAEIPPLETQLATLQKHWDDANAVFKNPNAAFEAVEATLANLRPLDEKITTLDKAVANLGSTSGTTPPKPGETKPGG